MTKAKEEENRLWKLRHRVSYHKWEKAYGRFKGLGLSHKKCFEACCIAFGAVEDFHGHGTETYAYYSSESLTQVAEDKKKADRRSA